MKLKKLLSLLLAASMAVSVAACGDKETTESSSAAGASSEVVQEQTKEEQITFPLTEEKTYSVFTVMTSGKYDLKDNLVIKTLEDETNVHLDLQSVLPADLKEKRNLLLSSGDYPEIFLKTSITKAEQNEFGSQVVLMH